jgi:hypothetical protein
MSKPLLDLDTQERDVIAIDGKQYEILQPDDFGLADLAAIRRAYRTVVSVQGKSEDDLTDDDIEQLGKALDAVTQKVIPDMPAEVLARLRDGQKLQIVATFTKLAGRLGNLLPAKESPPSPPTGAS